MKKNRINVTRPQLPPLDEFIPYLEEIWLSGQLTNNGPFHQQLESELADYLGVSHLSLFANGTLALLTALQALRITGEVITTPFSFVATSHALLWNGIKPVFVDIEPETLNLDPAKIEASITPQTTAILPVHVYGNPCDFGAIEEIARNYNLKVIYDAAHAFGVKCHCGSVLQHGDLSVVSFHATKVFTTMEGGAIICPSARVKAHIDNLKNFGFVNETTVVSNGINGKMNEMQAALGLVQLKHIDATIDKRKLIDRRYREAFADIDGIDCIFRNAQLRDNYAYFPILVNDEYPCSREALNERLKDQGIYPRRYFYPLIPQFPMYRGPDFDDMSKLPIASASAERVLCLPIYPSLTEEEQDRVIAVIQDDNGQLL